MHTPSFRCSLCVRVSGLCVLCCRVRVRVTCWSFDTHSFIGLDARGCRSPGNQRDSSIHDQFPFTPTHSYSPCMWCIYIVSHSYIHYLPRWLRRGHPPECGRWYAPLPRHFRSLFSGEGGASSCGRLWCCSCRVIMWVTSFSSIHKCRLTKLPKLLPWTRYNSWSTLRHTSPIHSYLLLYSTLLFHASIHRCRLTRLPKPWLSTRWPHSWSTLECVRCCSPRQWRNGSWWTWVPWRGSSTVIRCAYCLSDVYDIYHPPPHTPHPPTHPHPTK